MPRAGQHAAEHLRDAMLLADRQRGAPRRRRAAASSAPERCARPPFDSPAACHGLLCRPPRRPKPESRAGAPAPAKCNLDACILAPAKSEAAMANDLLTREPIADFGEFRAYLRSERQEMVFEAFREADGRAWLLRVPLAARAAIDRPACATWRRCWPTSARDRRSRHPAPGGVGPQGRARRRAARGRPGARLRPVAARAAARRAGSWTIDVVVVPLELAAKSAG